MHEWALAESVVKTVKENNELNGKRIKVLIGELQSIELDIFRFALDEIIKQKNFKFDYSVEKTSAVFKCRSCNLVFNLNDIKLDDDEEKENVHFIPEMVKAFVKCPRCLSHDFDIVEGRGVTIAVVD